MSKKYDDLMASRELPEKMSILELDILGKELGIDVDAIRDKHLDALFEELDKGVREAYKRRAIKHSTEKDR